MVRMSSRLNGKLWEVSSEARHRATPGDCGVMGSQGPNARHSEALLTNTDRGIVMLRKLLRRQLDAMRAGRDPPRIVLFR